MIYCLTLILSYLLIHILGNVWISSMRCWVVHIGFLSPKREMFSLMCFECFSLLDNVKRGRKVFISNIHVTSQYHERGRNAEGRERKEFMELGGEWFMFGLSKEKRRKEREKRLFIDLIGSSIA